MDGNRVVKVAAVAVLAGGLAVGGWIRYKEVLPGMEFSVQLGVLGVVLCAWSGIAAWLLGWRRLSAGFAAGIATSVMIIGGQTVTGFLLGDGFARTDRLYTMMTFSVFLVVGTIAGFIGWGIAAGVGLVASAARSEARPRVKDLPKQPAKVPTTGNRTVKVAALSVLAVVWAVGGLITLTYAIRTGGYTDLTVLLRVLGLTVCVGSGAVAWLLGWRRLGAGFVAGIAAVVAMLAGQTLIGFLTSDHTAQDSATSTPSADAIGEYVLFYSFFLVVGATAGFIGWGIAAGVSHVASRYGPKHAHA